MAIRHTAPGLPRNPLTDPLSRRFLRRLAWVAVALGAVYTAAMLAWMMLDPTW